MALTGMTIPFIIALKLYTLYATELMLFKRIAERDGRSCLDTDIAMDKSEELLSLEECLARCAWLTCCTGVFYKTGSKMCVGCGANYGSPILLPMVDGTIAYNKKASYMDKCVTFIDCPLPNMACYDAKCQCDPGYPYDPISESCVTGCSAYGGTFQTFWQAELTSIPRETDTNCAVHYNVEPTECKAYCASQSWCKTFDHSAPLCTCKYHGQTAKTMPLNWLRTRESHIKMADQYQ